MITAAALLVACPRKAPEPAPKVAKRAIATALPAAATATAAPPAPATATAAPVAATEAAASSDLRAYIVWRAVGPAVSSWWIEGAGASWEVVAERTGLWLAARDDLYGWHITKRRIKVCDPVACAEEDGACVPTLVRNGPFEGRIEDVELVALVSGKRSPVGAKVPDNVALALGTPGFHRFVEPQIQRGERLVAHVRTETMSCGAMQGQDHADRVRVLVPQGLLVAEPPATPTDGKDQVLGEGPADDLAADAPDMVAIARLLPALDPEVVPETVRYGWSVVNPTGARRELLQQRFLCSKAAP